MVKVTPQKLLWMAGYAARKKPAEGKVQELFAKALALQDEQGNKLVFVTLDLIGVPQAMRHAVAERAEKEFKLPAANLVMNASHTHSGPELRRQHIARACPTSLLRQGAAPYARATCWRQAPPIP